MIKILSATGGSRHAERAVHLACRLITGKSELTVLTVSDSDEETLVKPVQDNASLIAQQHNTPVRLAHMSGVPERIIRNEAKKGFDLLVIGARGLHSVQDFFLGRNAIRLVRSLPVSTLVVRKKDSISHILWRVASGPIKQREVELIIHIIIAMQADITLLDVKPDARLFGQRHDPVPGSGNVYKPGKKLTRLKTYLQESTGHDISCRVRRGIPEEVILDEASIGNYDLVAVSAQTRRGLGKLFAEDLPYRIARNVPVSVLCFCQQGPI